MISGLGNSASSAASATSNKTATSALKSLQEKYPNLKMTAQAFSGEAQIKSYAMGCSGKYNVAIDPRALQNMGGDPELQQRLENTLNDVEKSHDMLEGLMRAGGSELIACGTIVDKDGNVTGSWSSGRTAGTGEKTFSRGKSNSELMKELQEKRAERKKEAARLEEKKQLEESREQVQDGLDASLDIEVKTETKNPGLDIEA